MLSDALANHLAAVLPDDAPPFALAFSGGGDSLSLLARLQDHPRLKAVLHVDHGLRDMSAKEAALARLMAAQFWHDAIILAWNPEMPPKTGLQEKARKARYKLMGDYCRCHGIEQLVTAHHADDQAETVMMRLDRATGWRGAAGMRLRHYGAVWPELAGITLVRPALAFDQSTLHAVGGVGQAIRDPSNHDDRFERVRVRRLLRAKPELKTDMIALATDMRSGLKRERTHRLKQMDGYHLTHEGLLRIPRLVDVPTLCALAPIIGGQAGPAQRNRVEAKAVQLSTRTRVAIGQGCLAKWDGATLTLSRDPVAMTGRSDGNLAPSAERQEIGPEPVVWDGRFLIRGTAGIIQPERRGHHVGFRIFYGRDVR
ncbi:MAG: tRNA lysidine(34) synthetase TilS, partial [Pseudomonadota bacterium]